MRVLVWAGAPLPAFHPTREEVAAEVETLVRGTRIRCRPDPREHPFHCHHEKTIVIDDELAFVGGIDMTDGGGDRFDLSEHPRAAAAGLARRGLAPAGAGGRRRRRALRHALARGDRRAARRRRPSAAGRREHGPGRPDGRRGHVRRACPWRLPHPRELPESASLRARARLPGEPVPVVARDRGRLADKLRDPPSDSFRLVVVLPRRRTTVRTTRVGNWPAGRRRRRRGPPPRAPRIRSRSGSRDDPLYVHAKVGIVDDRWLTVGWANLNAHSLLNDTEMNVVTDDAELARGTRERLWAEHLERRSRTSGPRPEGARRRRVEADRARAAAARARRQRRPPTG